MKKYQAVLMILAFLLSGLALVPFIGLSSERVAWQEYADVYEPPVEVIIQDFDFRPDFVIITPETTVRWTNQDEVDHTVTSDTTVFDSDRLSTGESFDYTFTDLGTYRYHCAIHPAMTGTILVVEEVFHSYLPIIMRGG